MDRSRSRCLPPLTSALILAAAMAVARSGASGQASGPSQVSRGTAPASAGNPPTPDAPGETLRHAVKGRFLIGTAVTARRLDAPGLAALVAQQFDCLTPEH